MNLIKNPPSFDLDGGVLESGMVFLLAIWDCGVVALGSNRITDIVCARIVVIAVHEESV